MYLVFTCMHACVECVVGSFRANVLITETFDSGLLGESVLSTLSDAFARITDHQVCLSVCLFVCRNAENNTAIMVAGSD